MAKPTLQNYVLLPQPNLRLPAVSESSETQRAYARLTTNTRLDDVLDADLSTKAVVLDTTGERGVKLIRLFESDLPDLRAQLPGLRIVPEVFYYPQRWQQEVRAKPEPLAGPTAPAVRIVLRDAVSNQPIANATVVAFSNFAQRAGEQGVSDAQGVVRFKNVGGRPIDQLYVYAKLGYWSFWQQKLPALTNGQTFVLQPLTLDNGDAKGVFYPPDDTLTGRGVSVGIVDTGAGPHPDLVIAGGACTVTGEDPTDFADVDEHGTHVAGIVAARGASGSGQAPTGVRGVAPDAELHVYRVFGKNSPSQDRRGASSFAIIKAIEQAVADGCDLINLSLGGGPPDPATEDAIRFAHDNGVVCFVATGNDGRQPVSFPASYSVSLAVSAMGRRGTFPADTTDAPNMAAPYGTDRRNFVAAFSNVGAEVDLIAPGVGIVSSVPGGYAPLSGTSMACPMATGAAARLLSGQPAILGLPRDAARSEAIVRFLAANTQLLGFGPTFEGIGMLFV